MGSHLKFQDAPAGLDPTRVEQEVRETLTRLGIPNPCCDVNDGEDGGCGIAIGTRLESIDTLYDYDHKHSSIPWVSIEKKASIRTVAEQLLASIRADGYLGEVQITDGLAIHATS